MDNIPKVSVIVPIYNVEKYLKRCMESLLKQTLRDIEIIMVDDESPDNCPAMCDEYAKQDKRIQVIHKKNGGLGFARNSGLGIATGEYIAFVDSDDFVDIKMYEILYKTAKEENADTVYCGVNFYENERVVISRKEVNKLTLFRGRKEIDGFLLDMIGPEPSYKGTVKYLMSAWRSIYSMEVINKYKLRFYSEREFISEDLLFNIDYLSNADSVIMIPQCYYYYSYNQNSISRTYRHDRFEFGLKFIDVVRYKLFELFNNDSIYKLRLMRLFYLINIISLIKQEVRCLSENSYATAIRNINSICINEKVREICEEYPYKKLPIKHRILFLLVKYKCSHILVMIFKLFNK
jgi:glycosyltransferase involved in cell wall biosynthesis